MILGACGAVAKPGLGDGARHRKQMPVVSNTMQAWLAARALERSLQPMVPGAHSWSTDQTYLAFNPCSGGKEAPWYSRHGTVGLTPRGLLQRVIEDGARFGYYSDTKLPVARIDALQVTDNRPDGFSVVVVAYDDHSVELTVIGPCVEWAGLPPLPRQ